MEDIDWRKELLDSMQFNQKEEKLLKNGPSSLSESWYLGALYTRWKKMMGIVEPSPPNCQSSFKEWNQKVD
tara:strand:- start:1215 stop:1427 length:213 start_codon:yes stop_codon:yes gene_type:complete